MSWSKIHVHLVFTTKGRIPFLTSNEIRSTVFEHIQSNAREKRIELDRVNGYQDHVHCLLVLGKNKPLAMSPD